ncbi:hypothetical protein BAE44_0018479 [Dichanthelium oligosanthes]|uniref:Uncharacterized protein n=1 Tax=Dichanthelium oligosanthes TaxID=888268 RepID=A0A1E5V641_9POAL|nr:hypothetical protein BAE44_0018479 [Dichanthelium oligosanthes]
MILCLKKNNIHLLCRLHPGTFIGCGFGRYCSVRKAGRPFSKYAEIVRLLLRWRSHKRPCL